LALEVGFPLDLFGGIVISLGEAGLLGFLGTVGFLGGRETVGASSFGPTLDLVVAAVQ
jgi:hypothetical protein